MKKRKTAAGILAGTLLALLLCACGAEPTAEPPVPEVTVTAPAEELEAPAEEPTEIEESEETAMLKLKIGETEVSVNWEDNESVEALRELCRTEPLTVPMSMYGGFEQVGPLGSSLPCSDRQTTTNAGDIVLYSGNQIVVFYGSNSWAYTRLGHITDQSAEDLAALLGQGDVTLTLYWAD